MAEQEYNVTEANANVNNMAGNQAQSECGLCD